MEFRLWLEDSENSLEDAWKDYLSWKSSFGKPNESPSMVRRTWPEIFAGMDDDEWSPNGLENLERLEKLRQTRIAQNASSEDHSARMKHIPKWFHSPDGKKFEYETPDGSYVIEKGEGGMLIGGDWELTAPDGERLGWHATPEMAAEEAAADWADNFNQG